MITPSARTAAEIKKPVTDPFFLIQLDFSGMVYLSTRGPTLWNGISWEQAQVEMGSVEYGDYGEYVANLRVPPAYKSQVVFQGVIDRAVYIGALWGEPPYAVEDIINLFEGVVIEARVTESWVDLRLGQRETEQLFSPRQSYEHQNMQPSGTRVTINQTTIEIERGEFY